MNSIKRGTPVDLLIEKFVAWLQEQPEYVSVLQMPRQQRRAAQRALADRLFQHITFGGDAEVNRGRRRREERGLKDAEKQQLRKEEARKRRVEQAMKTLIKDGALVANGETLEAESEQEKMDRIADDIQAQNEAEGDTLEDSELLKVQTELADGEA